MNKRIAMIAVFLILGAALVFAAGVKIKDSIHAKKIKLQIEAADASLASGKLIEARDIYKNILQENVDVNTAKSVYDKTGEANIKILFSSIKTPDSVTYTVQPSDTLDAIARKYGTTIALIKRSNSIKSGMIHPGMNLKINTGKFSIVVDKSQNLLTLKSGEEVVKVYNVSTGANNSTPVGTFKIVNKIIDPPWYSGGKAIPSGDPKNILGSRWMGLTAKSYGIHGTTLDETIGSQVTQGCVRMHNTEVEELYDIVPVGTEVTIVD